MCVCAYIRMNVYINPPGTSVSGVLQFDCQAYNLAMALLATLLAPSPRKTVHQYTIKSL